MNFTNRLMMMVAMRGKGFHWGRAGVGAAIMTLLYLGIAISSAINGDLLWLLVFGISTVFCAILAAVSFIVNYRKNTHRW